MSYFKFTSLGLLKYVFWGFTKQTYYRNQLRQYPISLLKITTTKGLLSLFLSTSAVACNIELLFLFRKNFVK